MVNGYDAPPVDDVVFDTTEEGSAAIAAEREHLARVEAELRELAGHIYAAQARYLELVGEFDRLKGWFDRGYRSANQWLSITTGAAPTTAREQLRVAGALRGFPEAHAALARGELSYDKACAATRMMTANNESDLVHVAIHAAPSDLRAMVAGYLAADRVRRIDAGEITENPETRYLSAHFDDSGSLRLRGRLDADEGAVVKKALDAAADLLFRQRPDEHAGRDGEARSADALVAMAEMTLASGDLPDTSAADRYQVVVTVDAATLGGHGDDLGMLEDSVALTRRALEHLSCDCSVVALVERDGVPLGVGRKTRRVSAPLRRALRHRDRHCRFPGCRAARFTDAHHRRHWVGDGGPTDLDNLVLLCRYHHRLVHHDGYRVEMTLEGGFRFFDRYGAEVVVDQATADPPGPPLPVRHEAAGLEIDDEAIMRWAGDYMDREKAVWLFLLDDPLDTS